MKEVAPEHLVFGTNDGQLIQLDTMPTAAEIKAKGLFHVALLHHDGSSCVFYDPYEAWFNGDDEPRFLGCDILTLKEYLKLAKVYGGETIGPGWFGRHASSETRGRAPASGLLGKMSRCEEAIDSLIATLVKLQRA